MKLTERLQEAFDKRVGGTAMLTASDLLSAMTSLEQTQAENAALKEQVAQLIELNNNLISHRTELNQRITLQADVIEQIWEALRHYAYRAGQDWQIDREALALQPSPEILQARDVQVAEAIRMRSNAAGNAT